MSSTRLFKLDPPTHLAVKRSDPVYNAHAYLTKVPLAAIKPFIEAFTEPGETVLDPFGQPVPAYNRGAMCQGKDGKLYWVVAAKLSDKSSTHLFISSNRGENWTYSCPVASDNKVSFNETSIYETPKGDLVAFMRTADLTITQPWRARPIMGRVSNPGRMPASRDTRITRCAFRINACCLSMATATLPSAFAPASWIPNAPASPRPGK